VNIARCAVNKINVSYRVDNKVSGALHEETNYGAEEIDGCRTIRRDYQNYRSCFKEANEKKFEKIRDEGMKKFIKEEFKKWKDRGETPKNTGDTKEPELLKRKTRKGWIPVKKVRFKENLQTIPIGRYERTKRYVKPGSNHHMEIYAILDSDGRETKWEADVVTMFEAYRRLKDKEPVIKRDHGPNTRFKWSLALRDAFMFKDQGPYIVYGLSKGKKDNIEITAYLHTCTGRKNAEEEKKRRITSPKDLQKICKIQVDVLGRISPAND